jgi:predicted nucleic acid-binding protein
LDLVIDANILFSALLKDSTTRRILTLYTLGNLRLYAPPDLIEEVLRYIPYLAKKARISKEDVSLLLNELLTYADIQISDKGRFGRYVKEAKKISPDPSDVSYFAVAMERHCRIWSNEKRLKRQKSVEIVTTKELLDMLDNVR